MIEVSQANVDYVSEKSSYTLEVTPSALAIIVDFGTYNYTQEDQLY